MKKNHFSKIIFIGIIVLGSLVSNAQTIISIVPESPTTVGSYVPFGNNISGFCGFIYKNIPAFTLHPGDRICFDLGALNDQDTRRNIYFSATTKNPDPYQGPDQNIMAVKWIKMVSENQVPLNSHGDLIIGNYELTYQAQQTFTFAGGGLLIGFGGNPPARSLDNGYEQVLVQTTSIDKSGYFFGRFYKLPDQFMGPFTTNVDLISIGGFKLQIDDPNRDVTPPIITLPADITVDCGASLLPSNTGKATATDDVTPAAKIIIGYTDFSLPDACGGAFTRAWTATDAAKNERVAYQTITVRAAKLPSITTAADTTVSCGTVPLSGKKTFSNGAGGTCLINGLSDASTFTVSTSNNIKIFTETWTATDICGRALVPVSRKITVSAAAIPIMKTPASITVAYGGVPPASTISFSNNLTGNCMISGTSNLSIFTAIPGINGGTVTETWTATDNMQRAVLPVSRTITVSAASVLTMIAPGAYTISCGWMPPASRIAFGNFKGGKYLVMGTSNLSTFSAIPGVAGGTIIETWTAKDNDGKTIIPVSRTLIVAAAVLPIMKAPIALTVIYGGIPVASRIPFSNYSGGNCLISGSSMPSTLSAMPTRSGGIITETWTATDVMGRILKPVSRIITVKAVTLAVAGKIAGSVLTEAILKNEFKVFDNKLSVYPNPSRGIINLVLTGDVSKVSLVEITDLLGQQVYSSKQFKPLIYLSDKTAGIYVIKVHVNSKIITTKIVMED